MKTIYVIDDSISVCIAIEKTLSSQGYEVVVERSGKAALAYLRGARPHLVICDIVLPDVDGREICDYVRRDPRLSNTPVIAISGLVDTHVEATARRAGAIRVMKKPFAPEELLSAVENGLAERSGAPPELAPPERAPEVAAPETPDGIADELLEELNALPSLRFSLVVSLEGRVVRQGRAQEAAGEEVVRPLVEIVRRSAVVAEWLGQTDPHQLIFQADDGLVITQRYGDHLAVAALADASVLGKARFTFARLRRKLAGRRSPHPSTRRQQ